MDISPAPHVRTFKKLRISLLHTCNMACSYCVPHSKSNATLPNIHKVVPYTQLFYMAEQLHKLLNLESIKLTGGEPTLYPHLLPLIQKLSSLNIPLSLTTNGAKLRQLLEKLPQNGLLQSINISLDAVDANVFKNITQTYLLENVKKNIDAAIQLGIHVKLNMVVMRGINNQQILPMLEFAHNKGITLRFLELMQMGHVKGHFFQAHFYSMQQILHTIEQEYDIAAQPRENNATAQYWRTHRGHAFGIIPNNSAPFCSDCNRLRLDAYGHLYGCITQEQPIILSSTDWAYLPAVSHALQKAMAYKKSVFTGNTRSMLVTGG